MNSNSNIHFLIYVGLVIFFPISFSLTDVTVTLICSYSYLKSLTDDVFECFLFFMCRQFSLTIDGGKCDRCVRRKMFSTCAENRTNHTNQFNCMFPFCWTNKWWWWWWWRSKDVSNQRSLTFWSPCCCYILV